MFFCAIATMLPYVMDRIETPTSNRTHAGFNAAKETKNIRNKMANAAAFGAIDKNAVTGVGAP